MGNHGNAWRPAHIHLSLFGPAFATRLVTQMYFPGDPLFYQDPIFHSVRERAGRERMIARSTLSRRCPSGRWRTGSTSCCGAASTPMEG